MVHFDFTVFLYSSYVAFAYSCLAYGALAFRQVSDSIDDKEFSSGEEFFSILNPTSTYLIIVYCILFIIFAIASLLQSEPIMVLYVASLAFCVNISQVVIRGRYQRHSIHRNGIIFRYIYFGENFFVEFSKIEKVRFSSELFWISVQFTIKNNDKIYVSKIRPKDLLTIKETIERYSKAEIIIENS
jgi:Co/Zn/Cd efflux system component